MKRILLIICLIVFFIFGGSVYYLNSDQYKASTNIDFNYSSKTGYLEYSNKNSDIGFIFFTGAKVEPEAYGYLSLADMNLFIVDSPFNIGFFSTGVPDKIIKNNPGLKRWIIGGHSLGGVVALSIADNNENINDVVLLGSYPTRSISESPLNILAIFGDRDGLITDYLDKISLLPKSAATKIINGGNHAGMGDYGNQKGDNLGEITFEKQHEIIILEIDKWRSK